MSRDRVEELLRGTVPRFDPAARQRAGLRLDAVISEELSRRSFRRRARWVIPTAVAVVASLAFLVQVLLPSGRGGPDRGVAAEIHRLGSLNSSRSELTLGDGAYLYRRYESARLHSQISTTTGTSFTRVDHVVEQSWLAADGSGLVRWRFLEDSDLMSAKDRDGWEAAGSPSLPQEGDVQELSYGRGDLDYHDVSGWPTDANGLRQAILREFDLDESDGSEHLLSAIGSLLAQQDMPPQLRLALFNLAAQIPGISVEHDVDDELGRRVISVSLVEGRTFSRLNFDPVDAQFLGQSESFPTAEDPMFIEWTAYLETAVVGSIGERPSP